MLFWFDRLQFDETNRQLIIFEFFETNENNINKINRESWNEDLATEIFDNFTIEKHKAIRNMMNNKNIIYYVIFYSLNDYENKKVLNYHDNELEVYEYNNFFELQRWFLNINNDNTSTWSKPLGEIKSETDYAEELIKQYWKENINNDDQGRNYTEKLLTKYDDNGHAITDLSGRVQKYNTLGFDFDLFIYSSETGCLLNIELAYNEKYIIPNVKCTPMRYCWGNGRKVSDNKRKYNNLWRATQLLGGRLAILNYTDKNNKKQKKDDMFGLSIINELDENLGFRNETKHQISKDNFETAINECVDSNCIDLSCFAKNAKNTIQYDHEYFDKWNGNRNNYE